MSTKIAIAALAIMFSFSGTADASRKKVKKNKTNVVKKVKRKAKAARQDSPTLKIKTRVKLKAPTHFAYERLRDATGGSTGFIAFPRSLGAKTRRVIAEFAPGHLYNPIFVQAIKLPGGGIEVAARSRIVGGPGISARVIAGSAKSQVKALRVFAAELSALAAR